MFGTLNQCAIKLTIFVVIGECTPAGYSMLNFPRIGDKHGGIAIIYKSNLKLSISPISHDINTHTTFEYACVTDISPDCLISSSSHT